MYPSLEEAKQIASSGEYRRIPVCTEMLSDRYTPIEVMRTLRAASRHCYMLESAEAHHQWGRYTFLGYSPTLELTCANGQVKLRCGKDVGEGQVKETLRSESPQAVIREILATNKSPKMPGMPTFTGGLVGYFSYDYICYSEPTLKFTGEDEDNFQDADLMLFDQVIAFDHYRQKLILICGVDTARLKESYQEAKEKLKGIEQLLKSGVKAYFAPLHLKEEIAPCFSREKYNRLSES